MIDEFTENSSNRMRAQRTSWGGGHACGVGRIYFAWRGITPWRDRLAKRLEEAFCEVVHE